MTTLIKASLGIDIGSEKNYARLYRTDPKTGKCIRIGKRKFDNTPKGHAKLLDWVLKRAPQDVPLLTAMEATGIYHESLAYFLTESGLPVSVVLPNKITNFTASYNEHSKNDWIDADMIARYAHEREPEVWSPATPSMRELKKLSRERQQLNDDINATRNREHAESNSGKPLQATLRRYTKHLNLLAEQLKEVEREIAKLCQEDEQLNEMVIRLNTLYGVDTITSVTILAETDGFRLFTKRTQLVKYAGYDVVQKESGTSVRGKTRISKKGNSRIRKALHFPAMTAIRQEGIFKDAYDRVFDRTKCKMQALVAVQRKLLVTMYAMTKNETDYQVNYHKKLQHAA